MLRAMFVKRGVRGLACGLLLSQVLRQLVYVGLKLNAFVLHGLEFVASETVPPDLPLQDLRELQEQVGLWVSCACDRWTFQPSRPCQRLSDLSVCLLIAVLGCRMRAGE
jgi:hypothetical protein